MLQTWEYDPSLLFFLSFLSVKYGPKIPFINKNAPHVHPVT